MRSQERLSYDFFDGPLPPVVFPGNGGKRAMILFLTGGSLDFDLDLLSPMKDILRENGFWVAMFRYRFRGEKRKHEAGLHTRIEDAASVVSWLKKEYPNMWLGVCGISMGGYVATHVVPYQPDGLVLVAPAAYDVSLLRGQICFGDEFRRCLRRGTYMQSDGFKNVARFSGPSLVIAFAGDTVVPPDVPRAYYSSLQPLRENVLREIAGDHFLFRNGGDHRRQRIVAEEIIQWSAGVLPVS
ncbi:MAG: alpha/beta hydrolase [Candidatus Liptonbacteria bacterium]|nr:alpha/beta hydrolase [Candidatus Liptonbacteria bacterium]